MTEQQHIEPDTKDWTWTVERRCPDCGFAAGEVGPDEVVGLVHRLTAPWPEVLARRDVATRPRPEVWSPLEYAAHVRDVCDVFGARLRLMLDEEAPTFADWDQDAAAIEKDYAASEPDTVADELAIAADGLAQGYATVTGPQWERRGIRSNGSEFTVLTLGRYCLHDLAHHLWDVGATA